MVNNGNVIRKIKLLQIQVLAGSRSTEFYFQDQPDLRNVNLLALWAITIGIVPKTYENNFPINAVAYSESYLTLYNMEGYAFVDKIPLYYFQAMIGNDNANLWGVLFNGQRVNWSKSFIHIADVNLISPVQPEYYQIAITYDYPVKK